MLLEAGLVMHFRPEKTQSYGGAVGTTEQTMTERYRKLLENDSTLYRYNIQFAYNDPKEHRKHGQL